MRRSPRSPVRCVHAGWWAVATYRVGTSAHQHIIIARHDAAGVSFAHWCPAALPDIGALAAALRAADPEQPDVPARWQRLTRCQFRKAWGQILN